MTITFGPRRGEGNDHHQRLALHRNPQCEDHDEERLPAEVFVLYGPGVMLTVQMGEPVPDSLSNDPTPLH